MSKKTFAVVGMGGVGGYFAAVLARAGHSVSVVARGAHLEAIRQDGLRILSPKGDFTTAVAKASDKPEDLGPVDAVILAVKAWQVDEAASAMRPLLTPLTKVLPLQNGVEASEQLRQILGPGHSLMGLCRIIASVVSPDAFVTADWIPRLRSGSRTARLCRRMGARWRRRSRLRASRFRHPRTCRRRCGKSCSLSPP